MSEVKIIERGNGFPDAGDYCVGTDEHGSPCLYAIDQCLGTIHTGDSRGNYVLGHATEADWDDCAESEWHSAEVAE
jgi:hypothetical protein